MLECCEHERGAHERVLRTVAACYARMSCLIESMLASALEALA